MDTGALSHMTGDNGDIYEFYSSSRPYSQHIIVGNEFSLPIVGTDSTNLHTPSTFSLHHVVYSPHLVKNLILVHEFTKNNNCSIQFDSSRFYVKDLHYKRIIMRSSSSGDIYPFFDTNKT